MKGPSETQVPTFYLNNNYTFLHDATDKHPSVDAELRAQRLMLHTILSDGIICIRFHFTLGQEDLDDLDKTKSTMNCLSGSLSRSLSGYQNTTQAIKL